MSAIAEFYASMQFRVDSSGLTAFRAEMELTKKEMGGTLALVAATAKALKSMLDSFGKMQHSFDAKSMQSWRKSIAAAARAYVKVMEASNGVLHQVSQEASKSQIKLSNFEKRLNSNIVALNSYATALMPVVLLLERLRGAAGSPLPRVGGGFRGGANGGSGAGGGAPHPPSGAGGGMGGMLAGAGLMSFMRPMLPTGMGIGGLLGSGYAFREIVTAGRELQAMEFKLKAVSESAEVFNSNLKFVKETSQGLALNVTEFGASYASIFQSAKRFAGVEQIQEMSLGMNKYFRTLQMTPDQIKGSLRAVGQMLNKEQVMAEELKNQLGERAAGVMDIFAKAAGTDVKGLFKLMQDGKVGSDIVLKAGVLMGEWADKQGTLSQALELSAAKQEQFNNTLKEASLLILKSGLDEFLASMFALGSKAVPVAAKAITRLMHSIKNTFSFLSAAITDVRVLIMGLLTYLLALNVAAIASIAGSTAALASFTVGIGIATRAAFVLLSKLKSVVVFLRPIALMLTALESVSILVDSLNGEDISNSWIISLIAWVDLLFAKMENGIASINLQFAEWSDKYDFLPSFQDNGNYDENGNVTPAYTKKKLQELVPNPEALKDKFKSGVDNKASYLNYNKETPNIAVHITLPQLSPAEANMLGSGDVKGFSISLGNSVYKALSDYTAYTS